ncbi:MAG: hypothetical protein ACI9FD_000724 [Gammaproteobacteria bacterium]
MERAERLQKQNQELQEKLDLLVERARLEALPAQIELGKTARQLVFHLLGFLRRKSLPKWQCNELRHWIGELLEPIAAVDLMDDDLRDEIARDSAQDMGYTIDEESKLAPHQQFEEMVRIDFENVLPEEHIDNKREIEAEVEKMVRRKFGDPRQSPPIQDMFQAELHEAERKREEEIEKFRRQARDELEDGFEDESQIPRADRGLLNRLFRRTANVLHPDKELDDDKRIERQALMHSLLEARKRGDILTIYKMHQDYTEADAMTGSDDEKQLLTALEQQIENLRDEQLRIINQSPIHAFVHEEFFARTDKATNIKIAAHIEDLYLQQSSWQEFMRQIRTLKALKPVLEQRSQYYFQDWDLDDEVSEFF